jgi:hypothetical protein
MAWGMTCGDGWYDILDRACEKLSKIEGVYAEQIKEKFGMLRFYIGMEKEAYKDGKELWREAHAICEEAEMESAKVCEDCGKPNDKRRSFNGWIHGVCAECFADMKKKRVKFVCKCGRECDEYMYDKEEQLCYECQYAKEKEE